jgi:hypothetical protein
VIRHIRDLLDGASLDPPADTHYGAMTWTPPERQMQAEPPPEPEQWSWEWWQARRRRDG